MEVTSILIDRKIWRRKHHLVESSLKKIMFQCDGTEVSLQASIDGRKFTFDLTRDEAIELRKGLTEFLEYKRG